jgi:hypothetical protein
MQLCKRCKKCRSLIETVSETFCQKFRSVFSVLSCVLCGAWCVVYVECCVRAACCSLCCAMYLIPVPFLTTSLLLSLCLSEAFSNSVAVPVPFHLTFPLCACLFGGSVESRRDNGGQTVTILPSCNTCHPVPYVSTLIPAPNSTSTPLVLICLSL